MHHMKVPALLEFALVCLFASIPLLPHRALHAQSSFTASTMVASTNPAPGAAAASAQGPMYYTVCRFQGLKEGHQIVYVTPVIHTDAATGTITQAFLTYMRTTYDVSQVHSESGYCTQLGNSADQQAYAMSSLEKDWAASKFEVVRVNWTDAPAEVAATNATVASATAAAAVPTAAANQNYVVCVSDRDAPVIYVSEIFPAVMPPAPAGSTRGNGGAQRAAIGAFQTPYLAFLQKKYGLKGSSNYPVRCGVSFPPTAGGLKAAEQYKQSVVDAAKQGQKQIIETGWKNQ